MKNELRIKKCKNSGLVLRVLSDINDGDTELLVPNSVDAAVEKHVPNYEIDGNEIVAIVNHVMEKEHYIEWIALVYENKEYMVKLYPEQEAIARFPYIPGSTLYAYCNKHALWMSEVK